MGRNPAPISQVLVSWMTGTRESVYTLPATGGAFPAGSVDLLAYCKALLTGP